MTETIKTQKVSAIDGNGQELSEQEKLILTGFKDVVQIAKGPAER